MTRARARARASPRGPERREAVAAEGCPGEARVLAAAWEAALAGQLLRAPGTQREPRRGRARPAAAQGDQARAGVRHGAPSARPVQTRSGAGCRKSRRRAC